MISKLPLNTFALLVAFISFIPEKYFLWGILLTMAISFGLWYKKMMPKFEELISLRGIASIILFLVPFILAPVYIWGPYTLQGYLIDQNTAFPLGFVIVTLSVIEFITGKRGD